VDNFCSNCGKQYAKNDDFCSKCGEERNWEDDDYDEDSSSTDYPNKSNQYGSWVAITCRACGGDGRGSFYFNNCYYCDGRGWVRRNLY